MANGKPGAPKGNRNGARSKRWIQCLERALKAEHDVYLSRLSGEVDPETGKPLKDRHHNIKGADLLYRAMVRMLVAAAEGDGKAMLELANRLDGKALQQVEVTADEAGADALVRAEERLRRITQGAVTMLDSDTPDGPDEDPAWLQ